MAITDAQKVDFLWKKTIYGVSNTGGSGKQGFEETIGSSSPIYSNSIMAQNVPVPAPNASDSVLQYYNTANAIRMTADITVAGNLAWLATETFDDAGTRLTNWIPPAIDAGYLVDVYSGNPTSGGVKLNGGTNNQEWVFDYTAGVLRFVNSLPAGVTSIYLVGHRYIGATGLFGAGVNLRDTAVTYNGNSISSGTYSFENFFEYAPQISTITVEINGQRIEATQYSITGRNLVINLDTLPYALDTDDIVSARYAFAS